MSTPDRSSSTPPQENISAGSSGLGTENWIMKALNDQREDLRELNSARRGISGRLDVLERKVMRAVYTLAGVIATVGVLWSGYQIATKFLDISITPKSHQTSE